MILYKEVCTYCNNDDVSIMLSVDIETTLVPWLMSEAETLLDKKLTARRLLDSTYL